MRAVLLPVFMLPRRPGWGIENGFRQHHLPPALSFLLLRTSGEKRVVHPDQLGLPLIIILCQVGLESTLLKAVCPELYATLYPRRIAAEIRQW